MTQQNYKEIWQFAMEQIKNEYISLGKETEFKLWFNIKYVEDEEDTISVAVASNFLWEEMLKKGNINKIKERIVKLTGQQNIEIKPIIKNTSVISNLDKKTEIDNKPKKNINNDIPETKKIIENTELKHPQLREDYNFNSFVPGDNSSFAYNAAIRAAKNPGKEFNPILFYGGVGLGKTHLMQAIGNYIYQQKGKAAKICYVSAESFTNEFILSINNKTTNKFKNKYRNLDVLLLDDIHFLQSKESTQEELFHTFNALYDSSSQMVFTCDRPITELKGVTDRLKTRFSRGLCIDLKPPSYETRHAILLKKLELLGKTIPEDVISYVAKNIETNVRDLESSLTKLIGYSELINQKLTIEIAQDQLRDTFSQPISGSIDVETIQKIVAEHYSISISDIKGKKRTKKFVIPRQIALFIARELTEYSFPELGNEFGGRDHTTAMHSYTKIESLLKTDSSLDATVKLLINEIKDYKK